MVGLGTRLREAGSGRLVVCPTLPDITDLLHFIGDCPLEGNPTEFAKVFPGRSIDVKVSRCRGADKAVEGFWNLFRSSRPLGAIRSRVHARNNRSRGGRRVFLQESCVRPVMKVRVRCGLGWSLNDDSRKRLISGTIMIGGRRKILLLLRLSFLRSFDETTEPQ